MMAHNSTIVCLISSLALCHAAVGQVAEVRENDPEVQGVRVETAAKAARLAELKAAPDLYAEGATKVYQGETLEAIDFHVGSIGGGAIRLNGKGELFRWQIFNNLTELHLPDSFFAIRAQSSASEPVVRTLNTAGEGPFEAMERLSFTGEFPFANYQFEDTALPLEVSMEAYSPFIPLDLKNSTLPVAVFNFTITNSSDETQQVTLLHSQQNAVGYEPIHRYDERSWNYMFSFGETVELIDSPANTPIKGTEYERYGKNRNQTSHQEGGAYVHLTAERKDDSINHGDLAIALLGEAEFSTVAAYSDLNGLFEQFKNKGELLKSPAGSQPSEAGKTQNTATAASFTLKPGESRKLTALIAWHFPDGINGGIINPKWSAGAWGGKLDGEAWGGKGNAYSKYWENAIEVLKYAEANLEANETATRDFHQSLYATTLPHWAKDRLSSQLAILTSKTLFWTEDDYVGGWEGTGPGDGSCAGNCAHVWHYAQAHARLFPHLGRRMTEQQLHYQYPDGAIPYRQPRGSVSADGQLGHVLQIYREHLMQTNDAWLKANFVKIRKSMDVCIQHWDSDRDGRLGGHQHTTLDCPISGNSSWMGSLYAAALRASAEMAAICGESDLARSYRELADKAIESHLNELWNGDYFAQRAGEHRARDYDNGSAIDQLLGQWWATQLNLGPLYPADKSRKAMQSLFKNNFRPDFEGIQTYPREFVKPEDAGMQIITWPEGGRPGGHTGYADEVMSGFEYSAIAEMLRTGLKEESFVALKAIYDRYDGRMRQDYKGAWGNWGFSGNPFGDDECGKMYSRALSHWSILLAYQGFEYDGPAKKIGFHPPLDEAEHRSFFSTSEGWGVFMQQQSFESLKASLSLEWGQLVLNQISLTLPDEQGVSQVTVKIDGKPVESELKRNEQQATIRIKEATLQKGQLLEIQLSL